MGKTSVKTACKPRFFRLDGATSAWRNSRYELTWISMRFGGAMTSLILPKLIRSAARDGILTSGYGPAPGRTVIFALNDHAAVPGLSWPGPARVSRAHVLSAPFEIVSTLFRSGKAERQQTCRPDNGKLLDFDFGASFLELLFGRVGVGLVGRFEHRLGRPFHQRLGFRQPQTRFHFADRLDHGDLFVRRDRGENHVEGG